MILLISTAGVYGEYGEQVTERATVGGVIYVTENGSGNSSGDSWDNAMPGIQLQDAIDAIESSGGEVWVAEGTYIPQKTSSSSLYRCTHDKSFELKNGVALYGGFAPEKSVIDKISRNPQMYETILSGDINGDDVDYFDQYEPTETRTDNVTHVVVAAYLDDSSILDGFVITGGKAYDGESSLSTCYYNRGGGLFIKSQVEYSSVSEESKYGPIIRNCNFRNNMASYGGGLFLWTGEEHVAEQYFVVENNVFENNYALIGGAVYAQSYYSEEYITQPYFKNNVFRNNYSVFLGGGLFIGGGLHFYSYASSPSFTFATDALQHEINAKVEGNTFAYNNAGHEGGGFAMNGVGLKENSLIAIENKFIGNSANYGGGCFLQAIDDYYSDGHLDAKFYNNVFANNTANTGGGGINIYETGSSPNLYVMFVNNTVVNNKAPIDHGSGFYDEAHGSYLIRNSIFWDISENESESTSSSLIQYSAVQGIEESNGNFNLSGGNEDSKGPHFVEPTSFLGVPTTEEQEIEIENANWSISTVSPLQEIANRSYLPESITTDLQGNVRIVGYLDMGAYEVNVDIMSVVKVEDNLNITIKPIDVFGITYNMKLELYKNPIDTGNFYWKLGKYSISERIADKAYLQDNWSIVFSPIDIFNTPYDAMLELYTNPEDPSNLYWKLQSATPQ